MDFTKQFQDIATTSQPTAILLRKVVVSVKKDKKLFSPEQLMKVVTLLMSSLPYILFRPKSETKDYVLLLFWATSQDDFNCALQKSVQKKNKKYCLMDFNCDLRSKTKRLHDVKYLSGSQLLVSENAK